MFRHTLKKLSRGIVFKRRLPREFGETLLYVTPESALGYWRFDLAKVDPFLFAMVRELVRPGMMIWDIGANVGLFSFAAASAGAQVLAVEADTWLANLMYRSTLLNKLPVTVLPAAVADCEGVSQLFLSEGGRASNSIERGFGVPQPVIAVTLDCLLKHFSPPQVLKIDIEGFEYAALRGGSKVLQARPRIFCEVTDNYEAIGQLLTDAEYRFYAARATDRQPLLRPSRDTLALPI